jgi:hypothetical protein
MNNKILPAVGAIALGLAALSSCSDENDVIVGEGRVFLSARINSDVKVVSRATAAEEYGDDCMIWISSDKGLVRRYEGINNIPAEGITLMNGNYVAEAWAGDSVSASWDKRWYKGSEAFEVTAGSNANVTVTCHVANVLATVKYADDIDDVLTDYTLTIGHSRGELTFAGTKDEQQGKTASFMMPSTSTSLHWIISGTTSEGALIQREGDIENVASAHEYVLNVTFDNNSGTEFGGGMLQVVVDDTMVEVEDTIEITTAPDIVGFGFDLGSTLYAEEGAMGQRSVYFSASSEFKSIGIESTALNSIAGLGTDYIDLYDLQGSAAEILASKGISFATETVANGGQLLKLTFAKSFTNLLTNGEYTFKFTAKDSKGKSSQATWHIIVSDAPVQTDEVDQMEVYTSKATLVGTVAKDGVESVGFNYRARGASDWTYVEGTVASTAAGVRSRAASFTKGTKFTAVVSDLTPGTTYEYAAVNDDFVGTIQTLTTEATVQLPNADFETWTTASDGAYQIGDGSFWDTGNHGSITMNKNVTYSSSECVHGGSLAAKLESQFVGVGSIGKFAAGNLFIGKYLKTDGTNGILGFGQKFSARPKAVKIWVKYTPGTVKYTNSGAPDIVKGEPDLGIIYTALLDETLDTSDSSYPGYPVLIKTKTSQLFNKTASNVIAYGEKVLEGNIQSADGGMVEITIPYDYARTDVKPTYIMLVCSASKGGDYFSGGPSVLYVDDVELVYE